MYKTLKTRVQRHWIHVLKKKQKTCLQRHKIHGFKDEKKPVKRNLRQVYNEAKNTSTKTKHTRLQRQANKDANDTSTITQQTERKTQKTRQEIRKTHLYKDIKTHLYKDIKRHMYKGTSTHVQRHKRHLYNDTIDTCTKIQENDDTSWGDEDGIRW